jgi:hypothetical protein
MSYLDDLLNDLRNRTEASDAPLAEARVRLQTVRTASGSFPGSLRTYRSGSLATHLMNDPITDGDGGLVLDRRKFPALGPEGGGAVPSDVTDELCAYIGPKIRQTYPDARVYRSKRGPKVHFGEEVEGQDLKKDTWEPSDPEAHARILREGLVGFRRTRRQITRLMKTWNAQFFTPGVSSFELAVWAWEFITPGLGLAKGLWTIFDSAATRLEADEPTPDPAGVSADLKLVGGVSVAAMASRLRKAADNMRAAIDAKADDDVLAALALVFPKYFDAPASSALQSSMKLLATGVPVAAAVLGVGVAASTSPLRRAYGADR